MGNGTRPRSGEQKCFVYAAVEHVLHDSIKRRTFQQCSAFFGQKGKLERQVNYLAVVFPAINFVLFIFKILESCTNRQVSNFSLFFFFFSFF